MLVNITYYKLLNEISKNVVCIACVKAKLTTLCAAACNHGIASVPTILGAGNYLSATRSEDNKQYLVKILHGFFFPNGRGV